MKVRFGFYHSGASVLYGRYAAVPECNVFFLQKGV